MRFAVQRWFSWWLVACSAGALVGCGENQGTSSPGVPQPGEPEPGDPVNPPIQPVDGVFESDAPNSNGAAPESAATDSANPAAPGTTTGSPPNAAVDDSDGESAAASTLLFRPRGTFLLISPAIRRSRR